MKHLLLLPLFVLLQSCSAFAYQNQGEFTREAIPALVHDLRFGARGAVIVDSTLTNSPYVTLVLGVADRWEGYYTSGQEITVDFLIAEAQQLAKNIEAALIAAGEVDTEKAARVRAMLDLLLDSLKFYVPPGTVIIPGPATGPAPTAVQPTQ